MSTVVDIINLEEKQLSKEQKLNPQDEKHTRNAGKTRENILAAAKIHFSHNSFENVGVREIARDANVDAALVNRYFGSKEKLFIEVVKVSFKRKEKEPLDYGDIDYIGESLAREMVAKIQKGPSEKKSDLFNLVIRSATSPFAAPIVAETLQEEFVVPFAKIIGGKDAELRAGLIISCIMGFSTMYFALKSPTIKPSDDEKIVKLLGSAIQSCINN